jgi:hypothetical protein
MEEDEIPTIRFECVQIAMSKDKNGYVMKLSIHPNDAPDDLLKDPLGQRYMAVLVRLDEHEQPVAPPDEAEGKAAVKVAATLCADEKFQGWLCFQGYADEISEEAAAIAIRTYCGIASRSELKTNKGARSKFLGLRDMFVANITRSSGWKRTT